MQPKLLDLTLELIQRCPNSCLFCSSLATADSEYQLSLGEIENVLDQAVDLGLRTIGISGGEPLLHPDISLIIPELTKRLVVRLYTTGIYLDPRGRAIHFSDWGAFDRTKTAIIFNVQSTDDAVHDRLTCSKGSLGLTARAIQSAKSEGFHVEVHMVPNLINLDTIESSVADLCGWGVDQVSFLRLVPQGRAEMNAPALVLNRENTSRLRSIMQNLSQADWGSMKLRFGIPFSGLFHQKLACNAGISKLIIRYDGVVLPCEAFKCARFDNFKLGHIHTDSLSEMLVYGKFHRQMNFLKDEAESYLESCPAQIHWAA